MLVGRPVWAKENPLRKVISSVIRIPKLGGGQAGRSNSLFLWATYIGYLSRTLSKGYGIKCATIGNILRT